MQLIVQNRSTGMIDGIGSVAAGRNGVESGSYIEGQDLCEFRYLVHSERKSRVAAIPADTIDATDSHFGGSWNCTEIGFRVVSRLPETSVMGA